MDMSFVVTWGFWKIIGAALKEGVLAVLGKLKWSILVERMVTRILVWSLDKLVAYKTNDLTVKLRDDILAMLGGEKLPEATKVLPNSYRLPKEAEQLLNIRKLGF